MGSAPPDRHQICFFCDESSQVKDDWFAVAGLAVPRQTIPKIAADLADIKAESGKVGEVKWKNAKSFGGRVHRGYIDYLFLLIDDKRAHFHIRFAEMGAYDHALSGPRKKTDTVSKSFYQLLLHRAIGFYHTKSDVWVYPDDGPCTELIPEQHPALCTEGGNKWGALGANCVQDIECRSSEAEPMLQLLDVTLGALAAYRNDRHLQEGYSPIKRELAEYAFARTKWAVITGNAYRRECTRWNVVPKW